MTTSDITEQELNLNTITRGKITWVNIERPTRREVDYLGQHYPFHALDLDDCLSRVQRPKIDEYDEYLFMVFHFPVFHKQARVTMPSQVSIFIAEDYLVSLHAGELRPLVTLFKDCQSNEKARQENMGRSTGYLLYRILDRLVNYCFPILYKIGGNIERVEEAIFGENPRDTVREISVLRRDLISFRRIVKPQLEAVELLEHSELPIFKEDPEVYFGDIADHLRKIQDSLDDYKEVVEGLYDTNNSLISFRINQVIRILTIISVILLPLSLVAGILGMNVWPLPSSNPWVFVAVIVVMVAIIVAMLSFFRWRRWI